MGDGRRLALFPGLDPAFEFGLTKAVASAQADHTRQQLARYEKGNKKVSSCSELRRPEAETGPFFEAEPHSAVLNIRHLLSKIGQRKLCLSFYQRKT